MFRSLRSLIASYPGQFWLLLSGSLLSTIGASMIWPFLTIYVSEKLGLPMTSIAFLFTINSFVGLLASFIAGMITDTFGRKWVMVLSLLVGGGIYVWMIWAGSLPAFALLMAVSGAFSPLYRVGADAMMADMIPTHQRIDAYALLRMSHNLGVAVGPAMGGFIAVRSYSLAFYIAAAGMTIYSLLIAVFARETITPEAKSAARAENKVSGVFRALRDIPFVSFIGATTTMMMTAAIMWMLLAVYAKENFGVPENQYGLIPTTNALMVVFLQYTVTQRTKKYPPLVMLSFGALLYAVGVGSVALGTGFWGFWLSMVIMTFGELIVSPIATTLAANMAPPDRRGRYMSLYNMTWGMAAGTGPVLGAALHDNISPRSTWIGAGAIGLVSAVGYLVVRRIFDPAHTLHPAAPAEAEVTQTG